MDNLSFGSLTEVCKRVKNIGVAKAGCFDDYDAVASLPDDWVPRRSGPVLINYLKNREENHYNIQGDIIKLAKESNEDIDMKIRELAENLLVLINQNRLDMECIVEKCKCPLSEECYEQVLKNLNELYTKRINNVLIFRTEADALEKNRANNLKKILRDKFHQLVPVGHMTPKALLHDFDEHVYNINQQILSNSRAFIELEAHLRVQLDEEIERLKSNLKQLQLGITMSSRDHNSQSSLPSTSLLKNIIHRSSIIESHKEHLPNYYLGDMEELEKCVSRLVKAYRTAVLNVYTGFQSKLNDLEKDLGNLEIGCNSDFSLSEFDILRSLLEKPLHRLSIFNKEEISCKSLLELTGADVPSMQKSLSSLGESLQKTFSILHIAGHLWDAHMLRCAHVQKLTLAAVEDLMTKHDATELANEIPINVSIEQLRCSSDEDKIEQQYNAIISLLGHTKEIYSEHNKSELDCLVEYVKLPAIMATTLLSEFDLFLEKFSIRPYSVHQLASSESLSISSNLNECSTNRLSNSHGFNLREPLPRAIMQTELQEKTLTNWQNGFLESFKHNISYVPDELKRQAELWVDERRASIQKRYAIKMMSYNIRLERIKAIRDTRLAELQHHRCRLQTHLDAVYYLIENLPVEVSHFATINSPFLYPLVEWLEKISVNINKVLDLDPQNYETKKLKMASYQLRLSMHRRLFEESLDNALAAYEIETGNRVQEARLSNVRFISKIKLHCEDGKYGTVEALNACASLRKASEALEICYNMSQAALHSRRSLLIAEADNRLSPLLQLLGNVTGKKSGPIAKKK